MYKPGLHLIATLSTTNIPLLEDYTGIRSFISEQIGAHRLTQLGEVYHTFEPVGYTGVVCLSESHISLHSWPEFGRLNLDIYLSNHKQVNDNVCREILDGIIGFLEAEVVQLNEISR